ncbi:MAG TPA: hypothetical protein VLC09_04855 [Polyangiaceae bacterium]|nr:hypothetical protein [Polyangiaceae bacterium]
MSDSKDGSGGAPSEEQLRALVEVVSIVAYADGALAADEERLLGVRVAELAPEADPTWISRVLPAVRPPSRPPKAWRGERLGELGELLQSEELRHKAFAIGVEVAQVEGGIGRREISTLASAAEQLGVDAKTALALLAAAERD